MGATQSFCFVTQGGEALVWGRLMIGCRTAIYPSRVYAHPICLCLGFYCAVVRWIAVGLEDQLASGG